LPHQKLIRRESVRRIVAVSDIHGWYIPLRELLEKGGIIEAVTEKEAVFSVDDDNFRYIGGEATILIPGDFVDVDEQGWKVLELITSIEKESQSAGGELIALSGNHEMDLLRRDSAYWGKLEGFIGWIRERPFAAVVNNILFVHGGISNSAFKQLDDAQREGEDLMKTFERVLEEDEEFRWEVVNRSFDPKKIDTLEKILQKTEVEYVVVGHVSIYGKRQGEIKLVGPEIDGGPRIFNIDSEMGDWHSKTGPKKRNGGMLSLSWANDSFEIDYIYR